MGLTNTQYDTIMRDYQRLQAKDQQELSARQEEIYGKFPEFSEIDRKIGLGKHCLCKTAALGYSCR